MNIIIPVAGIGKRLRPHTHTKPKPLLKVAGKSILGHIIDSIKPLNPEKIVFVIGHYGRMIKEYLKSNYPEYSSRFKYVEQERREGLGHAVYLALQKVEPSESVMVVLGDTIFDVDYKKILAGGRNTICVSETDDPRRFGIVRIDGDRVIDLVEKPENPPSNLAIVGIYYFLRGSEIYASLKFIIENNIKTKGEYQITDAMKHFIKENELFIYRIKGWYDCGKTETLLKTNRFLLERHNSPGSGKNSVIIPPVYIPRSVYIENSIIGPYVSVGDNSVIKNSIVRNSILYDGARVENVLLEDSIVGEDAAIVEDFKVMSIGDHSIIERLNRERKEE